MSDESNSPVEAPAPSVPDAAAVTADFDSEDDARGGPPNAEVLRSDSDDRPPPEPAGGRPSAELIEPASSSDQEEHPVTQQKSSSSSPPPPQPEDDEPTQAERLRRIGVGAPEERDIQFTQVRLKSEEFQDTEHEPQATAMKPPKWPPGFADPSKTREANKPKSRTCRLL
jgi:hypothetical protein